MPTTFALNPTDTKAYFATLRLDKSVIVSGINDSSDEENEAVDIAVTCVHDLSSEKFEIGSLHKEYSLQEESEQDSKNPVQTKRLYKIAESFIKTIKSYH